LRDLPRQAQICLIFGSLNNVDLLLQLSRSSYLSKISVGEKRKLFKRSFTKWRLGESGKSQEAPALHSETEVHDGERDAP
jgi:hypothetical protein